MKIPKPTDGDKAYFESLFEHHTHVDLKPMFGNMAAFVTGNMAAGLFGSAVGVRLDEGRRAELLAVPGTGPFGPEDRPMKEYVALPAVWREDPDATDAWITRALEHTSKLPPKPKKAKTKAT